MAAFQNPEHSNDRVDDNKRMEYDDLRSDLQKYQANSDHFGDDFLSAYEANHKPAYDRLQKLIADNKNGDENNAVISQSLQDVNHAFVGYEQADANLGETREQKLRNEQYDSILRKSEKPQEQKNSLDTGGRYLVETLDKFYGPAIKRLNSIADPVKQDRLRGQLDQSYAAFQSAKRANNGAGDNPAMRAALSRFEATTNQLPPLPQAQPALEKAPELTGRAAWLQRLHADPDAYIFKHAEKQMGGTRINVDLPTREDYTNSRIQDIIGPAGVISLSPEQLKTMILITSDQVKYTWNVAHKTWEDSQGERLRIANGTGFVYRDEALSAH